MMICAAGCSASMIVLGVLLATGATGSKTRGAAAAAMMFVCKFPKPQWSVNCCLTDWKLIPFLWVFKGVRKVYVITTSTGHWMVGDSLAGVLIQSLMISLETWIYHAFLVSRRKYGSVTSCWYWSHSHVQFVHYGFAPKERQQPPFQTGCSTLWSFRLHLSLFKICNGEHISVS